MELPLLYRWRAVQRAAPGLVIPHTKQLGHFGFRGVVAHVQASGLKAAAHVVCMLPAPAAPAPSVREFGLFRIRLSSAYPLNAVRR